MPDHITTEYGQTIYHVWDVPEYTKYPHSKKWYAAAILVVFGGIVYSIFAEDNYLFAFILLLITIIFMYHELREPGVSQFGITDKGIVWRGFLFPYKEVQSFWIVFEPGVQSIYFTFKKSTSPRLAVPLDDQDPEEIRGILTQYIAEDSVRDSEPLSDAVGRVLKF